MVKALLASIPVLLVFALAMVPPHAVLQPTQFSKSDINSVGRQVIVTGTLRFAFETVLLQKALRTINERIRGILVSIRKNTTQAVKLSTHAIMSTTGSAHNVNFSSDWSFQSCRKNSDSPTLLRRAGEISYVGNRLRFM